MKMKRPLACLVLFALAAPLMAADPNPTKNQSAQLTAAGRDFFESKVRPVLVKHCYECHSQQSGSAEGELRVDSRQAIRSGGARGPAVVPGDPQASWLLTAVRHDDADLQMPPKQRRLPDTVLADLTKWIEMGAPDPRDENAGPTSGAWRDPEAGRNFWAYQPPKIQDLPVVKQQDWPAGDLDYFILAELERQQLAPSADAKPLVLLRRVYFDLTGLPPAPRNMVEFGQRASEHGLATALAAEVDTLMASPAYGERWGRHWLDVARFGESSGKEANISFPYAFRYRDYVIDCFNEDLPYDRFLTEQLAGDLLPSESDAQRARLLIATGFLAMGPKNLDEANAFQFYADVIDEQIDATSRAVMATTVACARCHDHKFDPFSMRDYYGLAGVFASTKTFFGTAVSPANRMAGDPLPLPRGAGLQVFHASIPEQKVNDLKQQLDQLRQREKDGMAAVQKAVAEGKDPGDLFTLTEALRIFWTTGGIEGQLEKVSDTGEALPLAMGVQDRKQAINVPLLERGDIGKPGDPVPRGLPKVLSIPGSPALPSDQSGRLELARWLTHPQHPLTARVLVNRVWTHLFGAGLVRTVDNFGSTGERPSHPQLLDHLAVKFVQDGWSIKRLVRELVLSRTYRQASNYRADAFDQDPDNRLLWRASKRRLEAEVIRDRMLCASGELDTSRPAGSLVATVIGDGPISLIGLNKKLPKDLDGSVHRSVYLPVIRDRLPDVLDLFDFAEPSLVTGQRETTNVPLQALYLMNSPFVQQRAQALAARLEREAQTDERRVRRAFTLCFSRPPLEQEQQRVLAYLQAGQSKPGTEPSIGSDQAAAEAASARLVSCCQALLCTAEFRNLD